MVPAQNIAAGTGGLLGGHAGNLAPAPGRSV